MKKNYYIFHAGRLKRLENSLQFVKTKPINELKSDDLPQDGPLPGDTPPPDDAAEADESPRTFRPPTNEAERIYLPIEDIDSIFAFGELDFNTRVMNFLSQKGVVVHFFNYYGFYTGSFYPKESLVSGMLLVEQVRHYISRNRRFIIALRIIQAAVQNILHNLKYYDARGKDLKAAIEKVEEYYEQLPNQKSIAGIMGLEGNVREVYYRAFNTIIDQDIQFEKRVKHPPDNMINSMISFANSLVYTTVLSEIYKTQLNPLISFLHEPGERRFSLSLDVAEVFKPMLADRMIFSLLNKNQIDEKSFEKGLNYLYLKDDARKTIVKEFDDRLKTTVRHKTLNRNVSYRQLIRLELYKLIKHLIGDKEYEGFKIWW